MNIASILKHAIILMLKILTLPFAMVVCLYTGSVINYLWSWQPYYNVKNYQVYLDDHSITLADGEVARLINSGVKHQNHKTVKNGTMTMENINLDHMDQTFALYRHDGKDKLLIAPISYVFPCWPEYFMSLWCSIGPTLVEFEQQKIDIHRDHTRIYSLVYGTRRIKSWSDYWVLYRKGHWPSS